MSQTEVNHIYEHDWEDYPNFRASEFRCRGVERGLCNCGRDGNDMDPELLRALQELRNTLGKPVIIASGFRCPDYNVQVSTTGRDGPHTTGKAVDIAVYGGRVLEILKIIYTRPTTFHMTGIGLHQKGDYRARFIHLDTLWHNETSGPRPWCWTY